MTQSVLIDGSQGEGGGQIVRSSLTLSLVTGRPFVIENIRAGRESPGLKRQHLAAVRAAAEVCRGSVRGDALGSQRLEFTPGELRAGDYEFQVGSAGSATLVAQTITPALLLAKGPSQLRLEGGTHNPWAPPFDFLARVYLPLVRRLGPRVSAQLIQHGFYPQGRGRIALSIEPTERLTPFDLLERGRLVRRRVTARVAGLPLHIAEREVRTICEALAWNDDECLTEQAAAAGKGNVVFAELEYEHATELCTAFGRLGVRAEEVAREVVEQVRAYELHDAPVGEHLADQWLLPLGLAVWSGGPAASRASFRTGPLSDHARTHLQVLQQFLPIHAAVETFPNDASTLITLSLQ
ncbi:MAG: RNA 3'-terminal phosphate cyclase [Pirellulales bacterium]